MSRQGGLALAALALALAAPTGAALDVLPSEATLGDTEARILARSALGVVHVDTDPSILVGASAPGGEPGALAPAPRVLDAPHVWHGLDGVVVIVLQRPASDVAVDIVVDDGEQTGVWIEWPAAAKATPGAGALVALLGLALVATLRRSR